MDEPGSLLFWAPALLGGGTLVLLGVFVVRAPQWLSTSLVGVAPLGATLATVSTRSVLPRSARKRPALSWARRVPVREGLTTLAEKGGIVGEWRGRTWRCKTGHTHRGSRPDGSPCTYKKKKKSATKGQSSKPDYGKLMGTRGAPTQVSDLSTD